MLVGFFGKLVGIVLYLLPAETATVLNDKTPTIHLTRELLDKQGSTFKIPIKPMDNTNNDLFRGTIKLQLTVVQFRSSIHFKQKCICFKSEN